MLRFIIVIISAFSLWSAFSLPLPLKKREVKLEKSLTSEQLLSLKKGELVESQEEVEREVWPRFRFFKLIPTTPIRAISIFSDFVRQTEYVPELLSAKITKIEHFNSIFVQYVMHTPSPLPNAVYTTRNLLWNDSEGGYSVQWNLIESNVCKKTEGEAFFIPYEGQTLFIYTNHISPSLPVFAKMFAGRAKTDAKNTVLAISNYLAEKAKAGETELLKQQLQRASAVLLEGKDSYSVLLPAK